LKILRAQFQYIIFIVGIWTCAHVSIWTTQKINGDLESSFGSIFKVLLTVFGLDFVW